MTVRALVLTVLAASFATMTLAQSHQDFVAPVPVVVAAQAAPPPAPAQNGRGPTASPQIATPPTQTPPAARGRTAAD